MTHRSEIVIRQMSRRNWIKSLLPSLGWGALLLADLLTRTHQSKSISSTSVWLWLYPVILISFGLVIIIRLFKLPPMVLEFSGSSFSVFSRFGRRIVLPAGAVKDIRVAGFEDAIDDGDFLGGVALVLNPELVTSMSKLPNHIYYWNHRSVLILNPKNTEGNPNEWVSKFNKAGYPRP